MTSLLVQHILSALGWNLFPLFIMYLTMIGAKPNGLNSSKQNLNFQNFKI